MSDRARQPAGAAHRGDGAGTDARVAGDDALRRAKARRNAWLLGGLAVFFYVGYMAWIFIRSGGG